MWYLQGGRLTAQRQDRREELRLRAGAVRPRRGQYVDREGPAGQCPLSAAMASRVGRGQSARFAVAAAGVVAAAEREAVRPTGGGAGEGACCTRLGGPALDPGPDHDRDRPTLPPDLHNPGSAQAAGPQRLVLPHPGPTCHGTPRRCGGRVGSGGLAPRGRPAADRGAWPVFEDEADLSRTPPHARTWSPPSRTPIVRVRGCSRTRVSIAALTCYRPGHRSRLIYCRPTHPT
jgi:hypothetical protein